MKTAEDWLTDPSVKQRQTESDVVEWIQTIQLDAIKHGMTMAAEHIKPIDETCKCSDCAVRNAYNERILNFRDNFKL